MVTMPSNAAEALQVPVRTCDECASSYVDWWADEALWAKIVGQYEGSLCIDCFRVKCAQAGIVTVLVDSMARWPNLVGGELAETGSSQYLGSMGPD